MRRHLPVCLLSLLVFLSLSAFSQAAHAGLAANPNSINFGNQGVGSVGVSIPVTLANTDLSRTFTIVSINSSNGAFSVTGASLPATIPPGQSLTVGVVFTPSATQSFSGTVGFTTYYGWTVNVPLSGAGIQSQSGNQLSVNPSAVNFGNVALGSGATQLIQLSNSSGSSIGVNSVTTSGPDVSLLGFSPGMAVQPGQTLVLTVDFSPSAAENATGQLLFFTDAASSPIAVGWSGVGAQPSPSSTNQEPIGVSPASLNFSNVILGSANTQLVTITNNGSTPATLITVYVLGPDLSVGGWGAGTVIGPGQTLGITATFSPQSAENVSGTIAVFTDAMSLAIQIPWAGSSGQAQMPLTTAVQPQTSSGTATQSQSYSTTTASLTTVAQAQTPATTGVVDDSVSLLWNPSASNGVIGYNVYRGLVSGGPYNLVTPLMVTATAYLDAAVSSGQTYYYVVTSLESGDVESAFSSEAAAAVP
jgi:hypothetical protein